MNVVSRESLDRRAGAEELEEKDEQQHHERGAGHQKMLGFLRGGLKSASVDMVAL